MCWTSQHRHPSWNGVASGMRNSLHPGVPASCSIRTKDQTCNDNCVGLILCDSDFLISLHWPCFRERGKWSISFCLRFAIAVTLSTRTSMCLPPQCEEVDRWAQRVLKILTPLQTHFQRDTLCGWRCVLFSWPDRTLRRGYALQFSYQPPPLCVVFHTAFSNHAEMEALEEDLDSLLRKKAITYIPPQEMHMGFYFLYFLVRKESGGIVLSCT